MNLEIQTTTAVTESLRICFQIRIDDEGNHIRRLRALRSATNFADTKNSALDQVDTLPRYCQEEEVFRPIADLHDGLPEQSAA